MRAKRSGQAAKLRRWRWGIMALVLAGLALCLLAALPVQAARNTEKYCFPLDTAAWRISDAYGARTDPFTGKPAFHSGLDLACAEGTAVRAVQGGVVTAAAYSPSYGNHLMSYPISRPECINFLRETSGFFRTISPVAALIVTATSMIAPSPVSIISVQNISAELLILPRYSRLE